MTAGTKEVRTFGNSLLEFNESGKGVVAHLVEPGAHVVGRTVGREDAYSLETSLPVETVDVADSHIVVELIGKRLYVEVSVHHTSLHQSADSVFIEAI